MTRAAPDLSVVIPTRNRSTSLKRALASALAADAEVVVVDDASEDETAAAVASYRSGPVVYKRLSERRGPCYARNAGIDLARGELILFLDDDDLLLPGAGLTVRAVSARHPEADLFMHNCEQAIGGWSIPPGDRTERIRYADWLCGRWDRELKPVARRALLRSFRFDDTGASGEGLLWGRVIRERHVVASQTPIVRYDASGTERLTSALGLLRHARENASIAARWLEYFGADLRQRDSARYRRKVAAGICYSLLAGDREPAWMLAALPPGRSSAALRVGIGAARRLPTPLLRAAFLAARRELLATARARRLSSALRGG